MKNFIHHAHEVLAHIGHALLVVILYPLVLMEGIEQASSD